MSISLWGGVGSTLFLKGARRVLHRIHVRYPSAFLKDRGKGGGNKKTFCNKTRTQVRPGVEACYRRNL
jgi:hypothetical protein